MSDDFDRRLKSAIQRGQRRSERHRQATRAQQLSEEEFRRLHTSYRLSLSERIDQAIEGVVNHFPGFRKEVIYGDAGWGAACYRDDLRIVGGRRDNLYSRLEMTIRPLTEYHVLDLRGKATVANKEQFHRNHYVPLIEVDPDDFIGLIDAWAIEFAESYASRD